MSEVGYNRKFFSEHVILEGRELPRSSFRIQLKDEGDRIDCEVQSIRFPELRFRTPHGVGRWKYTSRKMLKSSVSKVAKSHGFTIVTWIRNY